MHDARSNLFREYLRLVEGLAPRRAHHGECDRHHVGRQLVLAFRAIQEGFAQLGYQIEFKVLKAEAVWACLEERRRVVFLGNRVGEPIVLAGSPPMERSKDRSVNDPDAIADLPASGNGEACVTPGL